MGFAKFLGKVAGEIRNAYKERKNEIVVDEKEQSGKGKTRDVLGS